MPPRMASEILLAELDETLAISGVAGEFTSYLQKDVSMPYAGELEDPDNYVIVSFTKPAQNSPQLRGNLEITKTDKELTFSLSDLYSRNSTGEQSLVDMVGFPRLVTGNSEHQLHDRHRRMAGFVVTVHLFEQTGEVQILDADKNRQIIAQQDLMQRGTVVGGGLNDADIVFGLAKSGVRALSNPRKPDRIY